MANISSRPAPRRLGLALIACSAAVLVPWTLYLTLTLPSGYTARHWRFTWVGFDCLLALLMAGTAIAGFQRRRLVVPLGFAAGVLLGCDAWFDVATASLTDVRASVISAGCAEIPLSFLLIRGASRLMLNGALGAGTPGDHPKPRWRDRLP